LVRREAVGTRGSLLLKKKLHKQKGTVGKKKGSIYFKGFRVGTDFLIMNEDIAPRIGSAEQRSLRGRRKKRKKRLHRR